MEQEKINRLQWILDDAVARGEIPGAILMVRKEGKETVYLESGYADIEAKKPVARDSIYKAGFIKPAGRGSADKGSNHRVQRKHGKRLLCQQHMTARVLLQFLKNPEIFF